MGDIPVKGCRRIFLADLASDLPPAFRHGELYQLADALLIQHFERVVLQDAGFDVGREELVLRILAAEGESGLRQVVGAEGEELRILGQAAGAQAGTLVLVSLPKQPSFGVDKMPWRQKARRHLRGGGLNLV